LERCDGISAIHSYRRGNGSAGEILGCGAFDKGSLTLVTYWPKG
jgi:hypothetical protein